MLPGTRCLASSLLLSFLYLFIVLDLPFTRNASSTVCSASVYPAQKRHSAISSTDKSTFGRSTRCVGRFFFLGSSSTRSYGRLWSPVFRPTTERNWFNNAPLPNAIPVPVLPLPINVSDTRLCESWTPGNTARIRPSLQQGTAASLRSLGAASSNPSLVPNHESIELGQLVVENSNSDVDPVDAPTSGKKSNSPLELVRTKFHRNKSQHSSRTGPRSGLGTSEEEMARRAELKRIMHKRIQDELKSEEEQPEPSTGSASGMADVHGSPRCHSSYHVDNSPDGNSALCTWLMTQGLSNHAHVTGRALEPPSKLAFEIEETIAKLPQDAVMRHCPSLESSELTKGQTCQPLQQCQDDDTANYSMPNKETSIARDVRCVNLTVGANIFDTSYPSKEIVCLPTPEISSTGSETRNAATSLHGLQLPPFRLSETSSYRHQEAELQTIEKRFGDVLSKRGRPPLKHSKFKEEFEETGPPVAITRSSFLLQKLHMPVLKRAKSSSKTDIQATPRCEAPAETLVVRSPNQPLQGHEGTTTRNLAPNMYLTPALEESTTDLWQRAVQLERESRKGAVRAAAVKKDRKKLASNSSVNLKVGRWRGVQRSISLESTNASDATVPNPHHLSAEDDPDRQKQPASPMSLGTKLPRRVMYDEQKRYRPHHESGDRGVRVLQNPNMGIPPPEAWSRWPSQTRKERTAAAGYSDGMKSRDFAIVASTGDGRIEWVTDKDPAATMTDLQLGSRSFSGKLGKAVKTGLEKLLPPKSGPLDEAGRSLSGHVAFADKRLEYPELEILPTEGGYKELKALE
ncbi:conserved hypothetical protein [Verticillium alfalfae VaMs.102]|uniref:Uncharacterized protein n=1 Tax=Verticillium alfalfae (strain VaMs.102 / ATCC MYA-4576 / FGSC 10136) TaxID=526221 RepID=C9SKI6_VERA1|nr:conserved hypothetical protein [Verticillium alfalfae VaMs.102]EEY19204.1 conserved hypothetical protein [Verticillium alfalfae VaMs.102]